MAESTWTGVNLFLQVWLSGFVGKFNLGKRFSLEAQGLFRIRRNPVMAHKKYTIHNVSSLSWGFCSISENRLQCYVVLTAEADT